MVAQLNTNLDLEEDGHHNTQHAQRKVDKKKVVDTIGYVRPRDGLTDQFLLRGDSVAYLDILVNIFTLCVDRSGSCRPGGGRYGSVCSRTEVTNLQTGS